MLVTPEGQPIFPDLDYEALCLMVQVHRAANREAYLERSRYRYFLMKSGTIDKWRREGCRPA